MASVMRFGRFLTRNNLNISLIHVKRAPAVFLVCNRNIFYCEERSKNTTVSIPHCFTNCISQRLYSSDKKITLKELNERVLEVCRSYDKVTADKITLDSHFMKDLGLDSLDHVEVIMAMEDEFGFEIPDADAERLLRPADIVRYVAEKEEVLE